MALDTISFKHKKIILKGGTEKLQKSFYLGNNNLNGKRIWRKNRYMYMYNWITLLYTWN